MKPTTDIVVGSPWAPALGHRQLGYGQDPGSPVAVVVLAVENAQVSQALRAAYDDYVRDTRDDEDEDDLLQIAGHPPWEHVEADTALLRFVVSECLHFQVLDLVACDPRPVVVVNRILGAELNDGVLHSPVRRIRHERVGLSSLGAKCALARPDRE